MSTSNNSIMNFIRNLAFVFVIIFSFESCIQNQQSIPFEPSNDYTLIYQEILSMEYALLNEDYDIVIHHSNNLDAVLKDGYKLFCPEESAQIDGARMTNRILVQHIQNRAYQDLLDDLRILKGTIIHLESDDDYDPYFAFLWRFEEDMHTATGIAMDPKLDLYEWNEFTYAVDCMNDSWTPLKMHFPSPEILNNDPVKYKKQTVHKIYLEKAIDKFNTAVRTADYEQYPLCETAEVVREAYVEYLNTFLESIRESDTFLARL